MSEWKTTCKKGRIDSGDLVVDVGVEIDGVQRLSIYREDGEDDRQEIAAQIVHEHNSYRELAKEASNVADLLESTVGRTTLVNRLRTLVILSHCSSSPAEATNG